jgi:hypothetical protein
MGGLSFDGDAASASEHRAPTYRTPATREFNHNETDQGNAL